MPEIRVLIVDDSAVVRQQLSAIFEAEPGIQVVGAASDPLIARRKIKELNPDVLTLDVEMPRMDGLTFLANLMRLRPMPVVMVSTLTQKGAEVTMRALEMGAIDFVSKPTMDLATTLGDYSIELIEKVLTAARVNGEQLGRAWKDQAKAPPQLLNRPFSTTRKIVALGASTGGTEAIASVLSELPADSPGVLIAQHLPGTFSAAFAKRLGESTSMRVQVAKNRDPIRDGHVYLAPGGEHHLTVRRNGSELNCHLVAGERVSGHRPSVDVMFDSIAEHAGSNALGVLMTGMGKDGAQGLMAMRKAASETICQDEKTSIVWGMPGSAVKLGAAKQVLPLESVAVAILKFANQ